MTEATRAAALSGEPSDAERRLLALAAGARDISTTSDHAAALDLLERVLDGIAEL